MIRRETIEKQQHHMRLHTERTYNATRSGNSYESVMKFRLIDSQHMRNSKSILLLFFAMADIKKTCAIEFDTHSMRHFCFPFNKQIVYFFVCLLIPLFVLRDQSNWRWFSFPFLFFRFH